MVVVAAEPQGSRSGRLGGCVVFGLVMAATGLAGCGSASSASSASAAGGPIRVVAAESQYGDVASQVGGRYVSVYSVESNPGVDPHTYELSPRVAAYVASAAVVIQNGAGYDPFMAKIEAAAGGHGTVLDVQRLLDRPARIGNPHLWYDPKTMAVVADALARDFTAREPAHAGDFRAGADRFKAALRTLDAALAAFRRAHPGVAVATTEPVADYLLKDAGVAVRTPFSFEADIMNGTDPAPQGLTLESELLRERRVKALVYNEQVTDTITAGFVRQARRAGVPVVAVYETMPQPGYDYQSWMLAELHALDRAVTSGLSTERL